MTKQDLRSRIRLYLKRQKEEDQLRKSRRIKEKLFRTAVFKKAKTVMFYISFAGEVNTQNMIKESQRLGKKIAVPVCGRKGCNLVPCLLDEHEPLKRGPYGVMEPAAKKPIPLDSLDLVIVPGLAFTVEGSRLGRGKGYYDRFLLRLSERTRSVGLAFDFQILARIPSEVHDQKVHRVIFA